MGTIGDYEERISELESELSIRTAERNGARTRAAAAEDAHASCYDDLQMEIARNRLAEAITAWTMGHE